MAKRLSITQSPTRLPRIETGNWALTSVVDSEEVDSLRLCHRSRLATLDSLRVADWVTQTLERQTGFVGSKSYQYDNKRLNTQASVSLPGWNTLYVLSDTEKVMLSQLLGEGQMANKSFTFEPFSYSFLHVSSLTNFSLCPFLVINLHWWGWRDGCSSRGTYRCTYS